MADATIGIDEPASIDKLLDTESLTVGANTVYRQRIQISGAAATAIAGVDATNGLDVDVTRVIPGTSATHLGKAIDAAAGSTDTGVALLAIRDDALSTLTPAEGDWSALRVDATGALWTTATLVSGTSVAVSSIAAGTNAIGKLASNSGVNIGEVSISAIVPSTGTTELGQAEDVAVPDGKVGVLAMVTRKDTPGNTSDTDGDAETLQISSGLLWARVKGLLTPNGDSVLDDVNDAVRVNIVADGVGSTVETEDGTVSAGNTNVAQTIACGYQHDGTNWVRPRGPNTVAHDAADAGNPLKLGAKAETSLSGLTLVSDGDRTDLFAGVDGVLIVRPHANLEDLVQERTTNTDGASTAFASGLAAPGSGVKLYVTDVTIANSSASFCTVDLRDGAAGSVLWTLPVPATGGVTAHFTTPLKLTANTALAFDASAATSTLTISAKGFKSKV